MSEKYAFRVTLRPQSGHCRQGKAKIRTLDFKTIWFEFQMASQTVTEQGEAKFQIFDFKTTWSEFQKHSQTATERGEAELSILDFETTWSVGQVSDGNEAKMYKQKLVFII